MARLPHQHARLREPQLTALADALAALPEADRPAIVEHVNALAHMDPAKRAAVLTLARGEA